MHPLFFAKITPPIVEHKNLYFRRKNTMVYVIGIGFIAMILAFGSICMKTDITTAFGTEINIGTMEIDLTKDEQ